MVEGLGSCSSSLILFQFCLATLLDSQPYGGRYERRGTVEAFSRHVRWSSDLKLRHQ